MKSLGKLETDFATLKEDYENGEVTKKGFCNKQLKLLHSHLSTEVLDSIAVIQTKLATKQLNEDEYFDTVTSILNPHMDLLFGKNKVKKDKTLQEISDNNIQISKYDNGNENSLQLKKEIKSDESPQEEDDEYVPQKKRRKTQGKKKTAPKCDTDSGVGRCDFCSKKLDDPELVMFQGNPNNAQEHIIALFDERLSVFHESSSVEDAPLSKITKFSIYDNNGHLCPLDTGLIEKNISLTMCGYLKSIVSDDPTCEDSIPVKEVGPINGWFINGLEVDEQPLLSLTTDFSEVVLMEPSDEYRPFMKTVFEKMYLVKIVMELCYRNENATFEDLLDALQTTTIVPGFVGVLTEDQLLRHAQFVCDQVLAFDDASEGEDQQLIVTPCLRTLILLAGVTFGERKRKIREVTGRSRGSVGKVPSKIVTYSKATTTELVRNVFEGFFKDQLNLKHEGPRRKRCGVCEDCQKSDCGTCTACLDMIKFGGTGKAKQACVKRRCPNSAVQDAEESDIEEDVDEVEVEVKKMKINKPARNIRTTENNKKQCKWLGDSEKCGEKLYYNSVCIDDEEIQVGDFVMVESDDPPDSQPIGKVCYMYEENSRNSKRKKCHVLWFLRGTDTILDNLSDSQQLYLSSSCEDIILNAVSRSCKVSLWKMSEDWAELGGFPQPSPPIDEKDQQTFYYRQMYDPVHARFSDLPDEKNAPRFCISCDKAENEKLLETPSLMNKVEENSTHDFYMSVSYQGQEHKLKSCVFVNPECFKFDKKKIAKSVKRSLEDEELYPEAYRKMADYVKGSNLNTPDPFGIGFIEAIFTKKGSKNPSADNICVRLKKFFRPENTHRSIDFNVQLDLNEIYWSDESEEVSLSDICGTCTVVCKDNLKDPVDKWSSCGPNRFYFSEAYNNKTKQFINIPSEAMLLGHTKGIGKNVKQQTNSKNANDWPSIKKPLRCLDVFAGAGGLSSGLEMSGVCEPNWAIEFDYSAAKAFEANHPKCTVFKGDCNKILQKVIDNNLTDSGDELLPKKGEVEMLCGGPPCQGFSGMNRFNQRQYSAFKNSLIVSYLSYCDYYRPKYFLLENVRNFVAFKNSMVLKLTLKCLTEMGYQCTFGILQAGHFGVSQTRRRAVILAAAPGELLPNYPEPLNVFLPRTSQLNVTIDKKTYVSTCKWIHSAPYRTITVRDVMSDLPEIHNGCQDEKLPYTADTQSHFQRQIRRHVSDVSVITDHICKKMAPLVEARMRHIPTQAGSDWRDLPNIETRLSDGTNSKKLLYTHHDIKNGKSSSDSLRGVCPCASGKKIPCDPLARQFGTLIPWCLPHTGNRHNNWSGLYGRLAWDGHFSTTITNPEPMGKQGRVLHPNQHRVVSVRECARSQGFPDHHQFYGTILEKHRQVGNAVPPPMGLAIGREILKAIAEKEESMHNQQKDVKVDGSA